MNNFASIFRELTRNDPFPWQKELLARFRNGTIERSLDIPTGLGKTAVMAIWLAARAEGAALPRRLVYVVDRRAVVDQATDVATDLRKNVDRSPEIKRALGLGARSLPISTLRGQHVDNKEWLEDPTSLAIIVGTVDMIGSRLLFAGYGTSRKMRPYHAGLLGADTLVVLDEAHLVPPFEKLLEAIAEGVALFGPRDKALQSLVPQFRLVSLSATGRAHGGASFSLQDADLKHPEVRRRLDGPKHLSMIPLSDEQKLADALAEEAWKLAENGTAAVRIIVFCDKRKDAEEAKEGIEKRAKGDKKQGISAVEVDTELFVGGRRVFEREQAANRLRERGFIAGTKVARALPAFLFATSAGEVGVDLDADHMVSDLVAWERMVQRLGRVNRRGDGVARVIVVVEQEPKPKKPVQMVLAKNPSDRTEKEATAVKGHETLIERARALLKPFDHLPKKRGAIDASTGAIRELKLRANEDPTLQAILSAATTPAPLRPALSRPLVDAWSVTSLKDHTGRPEVEPWLRGWIDDPHQTVIVWRRYLPVRTGIEAKDKKTEKEIEKFFEAAPPHSIELLETETYRVVEWLSARAKAIADALNGQKNEYIETSSQSIPLRSDDVFGVVLSPAGDLRTTFRRVNDFAFGSDDKELEKRNRDLSGATLIVDARIAGLRDGLLDQKADTPPHTFDDATQELVTTDKAPVVGFRVRVADSDTQVTRDGERRWRQRFRFATALSDDGEPSSWLIVDKWLQDAATEDDRSEGNPQLLDVHQQWAECKVRELADRLGLPDRYKNMLAVAARLHDEGKRAKRWQRAFNADGDGHYAKTLGPVNTALLDGYRHEFGSLAVAARNADLLKLPDELQELALHVIAAHHGFARPFIRTNGCEDAPPSALKERAREVALRFARLQKRWGPWGLAWWESLLRSADQLASRENDAADTSHVKETI